MGCNRPPGTVRSVGLGCVGSASAGGRWLADCASMEERPLAALGHLGVREWWGEQDSNLRRLCHQIYSLTSLAA
jgi:hypothetical protein